MVGLFKGSGILGGTGELTAAPEMMGWTEHAAGCMDFRTPSLGVFGIPGLL